MQNISAKVAVFGASNVDIMGFPKRPLIFGDANVGYSITSPGGVGRNIAENLKRLLFDVTLISFFGDDALSEYLINSCKKLGLPIENSLFLKEEATATFLAIMDHQNDLAVGISAMEIYEKITPLHFNTNFENLRHYDYFVLETNFKSDVMSFISSHKGNSKLVLDTVSGKKALRAQSILSEVYLLKTNLLEAKMLCNIALDKIIDPQFLVETLLLKGVENVFITMGKEGVIYGNNEIIDRQKSIPSEIINTVGAGDSFVSGMIYADALGLSIHDKAKYGMAAAAITVQYNGAVSPEMTIENLNKKLNQK